MTEARFYPSRQGRYALTADGRLHHWKANAAAKAVAMVRVRLKSTPAPAESAPPAPPPARPSRRPFSIDLNTVPSAMEARAASWSK